MQPKDQTQPPSDMEASVTPDSTQAPQDVSPTTAPELETTAPVVDTPPEAVPEETPEMPATPEVPSPETPAAVPPQEPTANVTPSSPVIGLPPMVSATTPEPAKKRFSKRTKIIALVAALVVLLVGGTAAAYFGVIVPAQPQRIVQDSLSNTLNQEKTTSAKFEGEFTCVSGEACKTFSTVLFSGSTNDKNAFEAKLQFKTAVTTIGLDLRSVGDKSVYLRLSGLDGLDKLLAGAAGDSQSSSAAMIAAYAPLIAKVNNQWYSIDESLLNRMETQVPLNSGDKLSEEEAKKIGDIYRKNQFIVVSKKLGDEKIHDQDSYHLQATIDKTKLKGFLTEVRAANIAGLEIDQENIDQLDKANFTKYPFDIWVSKSSRKVTQLATTIKEDELEARVRVAIFDYNKPVTVEKPADAKSVLELVSELYGGVGGTTGVRGASTANPLSLLQL